MVLYINAAKFSTIKRKETNKEDDNLVIGEELLGPSDKSWMRLKSARVISGTDDRDFWV